MDGECDLLVDVDVFLDDMSLFLRSFRHRSTRITNSRAASETLGFMEQ